MDALLGLAHAHSSGRIGFVLRWGEGNETDVVALVVIGPIVGKLDFTMSGIQNGMSILSQCLEPDGFLLFAVLVEQIAELTVGNLFSGGFLDVEIWVQIPMDNIVVARLAVAQSEGLVYITIRSIIVALDGGTGPTVANVTSTDVSRQRSTLLAAHNGPRGVAVIDEDGGPVAHVAAKDGTRIDTTSHAALICPLP